MAKRKATRRKPTTTTRRKTTAAAPKRRRRVGAVSKSAGIMDIVYPILGAVAGKLVVDKVLSKASPTIKNAVPLVLGFLMSRTTTPLLKGLGTGLIVFGGTGLVNSLTSQAITTVGNMRALPSGDAVSGKHLAAGDAVSGLKSYLKYAVKGS